MRQFIRRMLVLLAVLQLIQQALVASAADPDIETAKPAPPLPTDKNLWMNSSPYTWEQLKGKGVCLYFFMCNTEGIEVIPKYLDSAKLHALDPVIYIGVAMGSDRPNTEQTLKETKYNFPTLCDPTFTYTRMCDTSMGNKQSEAILGNVCDSIYVTPQGKMIQGWWDEPETTVSEALEGASWVTSPKEIPEPLWPLWRAVEFHKYSEALPVFKKSLSSGSDTQKEAARKLQQVVLTEIERLATEARTADEADEKWAAYTKASSVLDDFRGYEIPKDLEPLQKKLLKNSQVKAGILAQKQLPTIAQNLASPNAGLRKKAQLQLEKFTKDFPNSELARKAQELLDTPQTTPK